MTQQRTKGQLEAAICEAMIAFEKDYMGRGPLESKTYILDDLVIVRLQGVLTPAEKKLSVLQGQDSCGRNLVKQVRQELIESGRTVLEEAIEGVLGVSVKSLHTDISTKTGERIIVCTMERTIPFCH